MAEPKAAPAKKAPAKKTAPAPAFVEPKDGNPELIIQSGPHAGSKVRVLDDQPAPAQPVKPRPGSWVAVKAQVIGLRGPGHKGQVLVEVEGRGGVEEVLVRLDRVIGPTEPPIPDEPTTRGRVALVAGVAYQLVDITHARGWQGVGEDKLRTWEELHALGTVIVL